MLGNMKLSHRIWFGFGSILGLAGILGGIAIVSMSNVKTDATYLAKEFVPAVDVANNVERYSLNTMYNMRGFTMSEDDQYLEPTKKNLAEVNKYLTSASELGSKAEHLGFLKENAAKARENVDKYSKLAEDSFAIIAERNGIRKEMDAQAGEFMKQANSFLASQSKKMHDDIKSKLTTDKLNERFEKVSLINDVIDRGNWIRVANFKAQLTGDLTIAEGAQKWFDGEEGVYAFVGKLRQITRAEDDLRDLAEIESAGKAYQTAMKKMMDAGTRLGTLAKERGAAATLVLDAAKDTALSGIKNTQDIANKAMTTLGVAVWVLIIGLLACVGLGIMIAYFSANSITRPVLAVTQTLQAASVEMASATVQLSSASQRLSEASAESAASLEETSSSMEEFASMVQRNAGNAREVNTLAQASRQSAEKGDEEIRGLITAMDGIVKGSKKIEEIISVIDDIAFQTNLLALNAAVEAARAGEHGKGFAVVAEAVRNLSARSATAAKEISTIIKESVENSQTGARIANQSGESLKEILVSSKKVADLISEIASASQEQTQGIGQITQAISQVDQVTQGNSATAEEAAATSEELAAQADRLKDAVKVLVNMVHGKDGEQLMSAAHPTTQHHAPKVQHTAHPKAKRGQTVSINEARNDASKVIPFDTDSAPAKLDASSGF